MSERVSFSIVKRDEMPLDLSLRSNKYAPLLMAVAELNGREVIRVDEGVQKASAYLYYRMKIDPRMSGIKVAQRDGVLWVYREDKRGGKARLNSEEGQ